MRFVEVAKIPQKIRATNHKLEHELLEFMRMDIKTARVEFDEYEYSSIDSLRVCLKVVCSRIGLPIAVKMNNGEVYLVRSDK